MGHRDKLSARPEWSGSHASDPHAMSARGLRTESDRKLLDGTCSMATPVTPGRSGGGRQLDGTDSSIRGESLSWQGPCVYDLVFERVEHTPGVPLTSSGPGGGG